LNVCVDIFIRQIDKGAFIETFTYATSYFLSCGL